MSCVFTTVKPTFDVYYCFTRFVLKGWVVLVERHRNRFPPRFMFFVKEILRYEEKILLASHTVGQQILLLFFFLYISQSLRLETFFEIRTWDIAQKVEEYRSMRKTGVIESVLKIRSYLPGNTSAVRHASILFLPGCDGSFENKGTASFTPVPYEYCKSAIPFWPKYSPSTEKSTYFPPLSNPYSANLTFSTFEVKKKLLSSYKHTYV